MVVQVVAREQRVVLEQPVKVLRAVTQMLRRLETLVVVVERPRQVSRHPQALLPEKVVTVLPRLSRVRV